ncbi:MAG TPA: sigma factor-like helix-turn-helix DNA-binding protein [Acidimicrobiales bacterium]|nr:sigma factor-like helix-turn-helix DNA-binding protein [Acidimicrobiales bacterium]
MNERVDELGFRELVARVEPRLREALIALYGPGRGREATAASLAWAFENGVGEGADVAGTVRRLVEAAQRQSFLLRTPPLFDRSAGRVPWLEPELASALSVLPRGDRVAVLLVRGAGWTAGEVAALLEVDEEAVENRVRRCLPRLRRSLGPSAVGRLDDPADEEEARERARLLAAEEAGRDEVLGERFRTMFHDIVGSVSAEEALQPVLMPLEESAPGGSPRPWRLVVIGVAVLVLLVVGIVIGLGATRSTTVTAYTTPGPEPLPGALSDSVIVVPNPPQTTGPHPAKLRAVYEVDAETNRTLHTPVALEVPAASNPVATGPFVVDVVFHDLRSRPNAGEAIAFRSASTRTVDLGPASIAYPGLRPGTVWLLLHDSTLAGERSRRCSLREVSLTGGLLVPPARVPCAWQFLDAVQGGVLVLAPPGVTEVWHPRTGLTAPLPGFSAPLVEAVGSTAVAEHWTQFCSVDCRLWVANPVSLHITDVHLDPPTGVSLTTSAALSPNGRFLAVAALPIGVATTIENSPIVSSGCCYRGTRRVEGRLVVIRVATGQVAMSRPASFLDPPVVEWAPDGSYVFLTRSLHAVEAVPVWADGAPVHVIHFPTRVTTPPDPGERFLVVNR